MSKDKVLFVCVHNAGRSQMAEAFLNRLAAERGLALRGVSAGTLPSGALNPQVVAAMAEIGIPLDDQAPKLLTQELVAAADRIITMGCGVDVDACPAGFLVSEDWGLDDPAEQPIEVVRAIRDTIGQRVAALVDELEAAK